MGIRKELGYVTKIYETVDLDEAAAMLTQGGWVIIAAAKGRNGYLFSLGYMNFSASNARGQEEEIRNPAHLDCPDHKDRTSQGSRGGRQSHLQIGPEKQKAHSIDLF